MAAVAVPAMRVPAMRVPAMRVAAMRVTTMRVAAMRVAAMRVAAMRVAAMRVAAMRVTARAASRISRRRRGSVSAGAASSVLGRCRRVTTIRAIGLRRTQKTSQRSYRRSTHNWHSVHSSCSRVPQQGLKDFSALRALTRCRCCVCYALSLLLQAWDVSCGVS